MRSDKIVSQNSTVPYTKLADPCLDRICYTEMVTIQTRSSIKPGMTVLIVLKQDQRTGKLTKGVVKEILTKSPTHPHGIKVRLESGAVGRVKEIVS
jgi:uncharacterized repeat protein (TIGR03833 family)